MRPNPDPFDGDDVAFAVIVFGLFVVVVLLLLATVDALA